MSAVRNVVAGAVPGEIPGAVPGRSVFNFAAGPAIMPREVLEQARDELLDWNGTGQSVWEMPFTGPDYRSIAEAAEADLRALLDIPSDYHVLFLQGGASAQFSLVPLNLAGPDDLVDYVETGHWAHRAIGEARRYCRVNVVASNAADGFRALPPRGSWQLSKHAAYCHITSNETANGLEFHSVPDVGEVPLVADMTSNLLSHPIDIARYGLVYAGAQKNIGPAGLTILIVRDDLIGRARPETPTVFNYQVQVESHGRVNTPLTYAIYLAGLVFRWLRECGGLSAIGAVNARKSAKLYDAIDQSAFYECLVARSDRSRMNVCFELADPDLQTDFLEQAAGQGLMNLKGHSAIGGLRASLYNAMPEAGVDALIAFMEDFERRRG